jgi:hypothetical protein
LLFTPVTIRTPTGEEKPLNFYFSKMAKISCLQYRGEERENMFFPLSGRSVLIEDFTDAFSGLKDSR